MDLEFEDSLIYRMSSRTARATQRKPCFKKQKTQNKPIKQKTPTNQNKIKLSSSSDAWRLQAEGMPTVRIYDSSLISKNLCHSGYLDCILALMVPAHKTEPWLMAAASRHTNSFEGVLVPTTVTVPFSN